MPEVSLDKGGDNIPSAKHSLHSGPRIALFMRMLADGGVERVMLNLATIFVERGYRVDLLTCRGGVFEKQVPAGVEVIFLKKSPLRRWRASLLRADPFGIFTALLPILLSRRTALEVHCLPDLVRYLQHAQPDALLAAMPYGNLTALWARQAAGTATRIAVSEHSPLFVVVEDPRLQRKAHWRFLRSLVHRLYPRADAIIAVSDGIADELAQTAALRRSIITTVYNPVVSDMLYKRARETVTHPWLAPGEPPVILSAGRLTAQKDFPTLLRAFARLRQRQEARLVILGEGDDRTTLERLARELGIADAVDMPGFVANPYAYMARASLFVLSSIFEGLPTVLIEALACGCPVVSTDCPSGPAEILENGRWGPLVPMSDDAALAEAMFATLAAPPERAWLRERGAFFSIERAAERYCELLFGEGTTVRHKDARR